MTWNLRTTGWEVWLARDNLCSGTDSASFPPSSRAGPRDCSLGCSVPTRSGQEGSHGWSVDLVLLSRGPVSGWAGESPRCPLVYLATPLPPAFAWSLILFYIEWMAGGLNTSVPNTERDKPISARATSQTHGLGKSGTNWGWHWTSPLLVGISKSPEHLATTFQTCLSPRGTY